MPCTLAEVHEVGRAPLLGDPVIIPTLEEAADAVGDTVFACCGSETD
jgi:hypothetical protein